jgi:hypothetical protein
LAVVFVASVIESFGEAARAQVTPVETVEVAEVADPAIVEESAERSFAPAPTIVVEAAEDHAA